MRWSVSTLISEVAGNHMQGMVRVLAGPRSIRPKLILGAIVLWAVVTAPFAVLLAIGTDRSWALVVLLGGPLAWALRGQPVAAAAIMVAGATVLRLSYVGISEGNQLLLSQLAFERVLAGQNPYGFTYPEIGTPFSYGPLSMLTAYAGIAGEVLATIGISVILIYCRAWMTLAFFNAWPLFIYTAVVATNDYVPAFVILLALVTLRTAPRVGMVTLAVATALKPYAAAWALPAAIFAGFGPSLIALAVAFTLWLPVLTVWGIRSFLDSVRGVEEERIRLAGSGMASWSIDVPILRWLAVPIEFAGVFVRSWSGMVVVGIAAFLVFLGFSPWSHYAYLACVVPAIGLLFEWRPPADPGGLLAGQSEHRDNR